MSSTDKIKHKALELGFDLVGITDASPLNAEQAEFLAGWLKAGCAGQMTYMHRNFAQRTDPAKLLHNAQSVIVVGLNYKPPKSPLSLRASRSDAKQSHLRRREAPTGKVAIYAQYEDYHPFIRKRLRKLTGYIASIAGRDAQFKICVDSAPLAERAYAARAGLGFIGKNRMLINPTLGPQIFLGEIITTLKLQPDAPLFYHADVARCHSERSEESHKSPATKCASCEKCLAACPTGALGANGRFDATKCISYLTIEYKGRIPVDLAGKIDDRLFSCDECVLACPYQNSAPPQGVLRKESLGLRTARRNKDFKFYPDRAELDLHEVLSLTAESFDAKFADSPLKRPGLETLKRNAQTCLTNKTRNP